MSIDKQKNAEDALEQIKNHLQQNLFAVTLNSPPDEIKEGQPFKTKLGCVCTGDMAVIVSGILAAMEENPSVEAIICVAANRFQERKRQGSFGEFMEFLKSMPGTARR